MTDKYEPYACEYRMGDSTWSLVIVACSFEDARRRLRAIGTTGQVLGNNLIEVPSAPGVGLMVRLWCAIANFFGVRRND